MTQSSQTILLCKISDFSFWKKRKWIWHKNFNFHQWCSVSALNITLKISDFLDALIAFVHDYQNTADEINNMNNDLNWKLKDSLSITSYYMCVHKSLKCWKWNRKNIQNFERLIDEKVYCISDWQKRKDHWKYNCVLIQKWLKDTETALSTLNN